MPKQRQLELNKEYPAPNEEALIEASIGIIQNIVEQRYLQGLTYRGFHPKSHVAVRATLTVDSDLAERFRIGLFREPGTVYQAWIRYSSGSPTVAEDSKKDLRGMAIKLMGVPGTKLIPGDENCNTHDLVFMTPEVFLMSNAEDFYNFARTGAMNFRWTAGVFFRAAAFLLRKPGIGLSLLRAEKRIGSLLEQSWFSATPYLFGDRAVKYSLRPTLKPTSPIPSKPALNYLRERLAEQLSQSEASFDLRIQYQLDPYKQPIEDALVPWREEDSPWHKIATLKLPKQTLNLPEDVLFSEHLSMNPWRCLPEHRPLGGVNRMRKRIYQEGSRWRHDRNNVPVSEPESPQSAMTGKS